MYFCNFPTKFLSMGEVLNSWQVYFPCYCKNSNIGRGQIEVLTFYWFFETKEKASDCFLFKVYAKSILMRRQIIAFRGKRRFMRRNCSRRNHFLNSWLMSDFEVSDYLAFAYFVDHLVCWILCLFHSLSIYLFLHNKIHVKR